METELYTVKDVAKFFQIGRNKAYDLMHEPGFPSFKLGKQMRVPKEQLLLWTKNQIKPIANNTNNYAKENK